ncbi:MAG: hypothetical protein PHH00_01630 [Candidatus Nanoarchaeia archaeon]|nr:hypothetical protein [Candidatus Nanoarchaeia archaeon]
MKSIEEVGYAVAFKSAYDTVINQAALTGCPRADLRDSRPGLRDVQKIYINDVKTFFAGVTRSLSSVLEHGKTGYKPTENLREILRMLTGELREPSREDVQRGIERIGWVVRGLDAVAGNPDRLYEDPKEVQKLAGILRNFMAFYAPSHQVLRCRGTPTPSD